MHVLKNISELKQGQFHVWFAGVDRPPAEIREFQKLISPKEGARARRFHAMQDRERYIVQQGVLRTLLAGYLGCETGRLEVASSANGKPHLAGPKAERDLQFSVSRSGAHAAFAFYQYNSIGVDIEEVRKIPELEEIVMQHFTPRERQAVLSCPEEQRLMRFYRVWTRKEAVLKAQGEGFLKDLKCVDVAGGEGPGPWPVRLIEKGTAQEYVLADIEAPAGFCAAVAAAGSHPSFSISVNFI
jgi:4'-phosphopantetheinyl transferase